MIQKLLVVILQQLKLTQDDSWLKRVLTQASNTQWDISYSPSGWHSELMRVFGIKHHLTTAYHPQVNGLDEWFNQTLINSLAKFVQDDCDTWDQHLQEVVSCTTVWRNSFLHVWHKSNGFWQIPLAEESQQANQVHFAIYSNLLLVEDATIPPLHLVQNMHLQFCIATNRYCIIWESLSEPHIDHDNVPMLRGMFVCIFLCIWYAFVAPMFPRTRLFNQ